MGRLDGKVALITGAARGIGEAFARVFAGEGARVVLGDLLDAEGEAVAKSIGDAALYLHHDVREPASWARWVDAALQRFGGIDALVNNAGVMVVKPLLETDLEQYMDVVRTNQAGVFLGMKAVAPAMARRGGGSIINVSSTQGLRGARNLLAYAASKFAVRGMTQSAAIELGPLGIRVNAIHPGGIDTVMGRGDFPGFEDIDSDAFFRATPAGRRGRPDEVARLGVYLASDESSYVRGASFVVDGGMSAGERF